jgi:uncharacterized LabA/DUF88 family protein
VSSGNSAPPLPEILAPGITKVDIRKVRNFSLGSIPRCEREIEGWEDKETDVALGGTAVELLHLRAWDTLVIVSGDTDLASSIRAAKRLFPESQVWVGFPHGMRPATSPVESLRSCQS